MEAIKPSSYKYLIIVLIVIISGIIIIAGTLYYNNDKNITRNEKYNELKAIANLKINEFLLWQNERISDAKFISNNYRMVYDIENLVSGNLNSKKNIYKEFSRFRDLYGYDNIFILNSSGLLLFTLDSTVNAIDSISLRLAQKAKKLNDVFVGDFYMCSIHEKVHYDIMAPVKGENNKYIATIFFSINPEDFLYPLIQKWPTPSKSAETLIVRSENDSIVFLNELRHAKGTALRMKSSINNKNLPAVQAALGKTGFFEGRDYRNIDVLAHLDKIQGTNWYMVSKVDKKEIFEELNKEATYITLMVLILILLNGALLTWIYNSRQKNIYKKLLANEIELHESQEEHRATLYSIGDGVITTDKKGIIKQLNPIAEKLTGWTETEARGKKLEEVFKIINEGTLETVENPVKKVLKEGLIVGLANHTLLISKDGNRIPIADSGAPIKDVKGNITGVVLVFRDQIEERLNQKILTESEQRLRSTLDNMLEGCQIIDLDWKYVYLNNVAEIHNRRPKSELLGKKYMDMWPGIEETNIFLLIKKCMDEKIPGHVVNKFVFPDGAVGWFDLSIEPIPEGVFILSIDITEKMKAEENLRQSEARFQSYIDYSPLGVFITDNNGKYIDVNKAACDMTGYSKEELLSMSISDLIPNELLPVFENVKNEGEAHVEIPFIHKNKSSRYWIVSAVKLSENRFLGFVNDITERKNSEIALRESEAYIKVILNNLPIGVAVNSVDPTVQFEYMNDNFAKFYRTSKENLTDNNVFWEAVYEDPEFREKIKKKVLDDCATGNPDQMLWEDIPIRKGQLISYISAKNIPIAGNGLMISVVWDVTERKKAEIELTKRENLLQRIFDILPIGLWFADKNGKIIKGNPAGIKIWGAEPKVGIEEYKVFKARRLPSGEEIANNDWALYHTVTRGVTITDELLEIDAFDGAKKIVLNYTAPIFDNDGNIDGAIVVNNDITNLKLTEAQLKERELLFQALMDNSPIYIFFKDLDIKSIHLSKNYEQMLGKPLSELLGKDMFELFPSELAKKMIEDDKKIIKEGKMIVVDEIFNDRYYTTIKFPIRDENNSPILAGFTIDITDRKKVEQEIIKLNEELELRIQERTRDLENKNSELERMNKAFIGREMRIKELKEKIKELENRN